MNCLAALPVGGTVPIDVAVPANPALVGFTGHAQVVSLEFSPAFDILALSSSNGLAFTIGSF